MVVKVEASEERVNLIGLESINSIKHNNIVTSQEGYSTCLQYDC